MSWTSSALFTHFVEHSCSLMSLKLILFPIFPVSILIDALLSHAACNHLTGFFCSLLQTQHLTLLVPIWKDFNGYELKFTFLHAAQEALSTSNLISSKMDTLLQYEPLRSPKIQPALFFCHYTPAPGILSAWSALLLICPHPAYFSGLN